MAKTKILQLNKFIHIPLNILFFILVLLQTYSHKLFAADTCSRLATINYQKVLVDTSSTKKGEGLRYYLDKDPIAKEYLDEYQRVSRPKWYQAALGTVGTVFIITGLSKSGSFTDNGFSSKRAFTIGGALLITVNFLIAKTIEYNNERLLMRAIEEYNKRNLPRIYFTPFKDESGRERNQNLGLSIGIIKDF